jgi:hypothetical protein
LHRGDDRPTVADDGCADFLGELGDGHYLPFVTCYLYKWPVRGAEARCALRICGCSKEPPP